jgi:hypothetical protein
MHAWQLEGRSGLSTIVDIEDLDTLVGTDGADSIIPWVVLTACREVTATISSKSEDAC